MEVTTFVDVLLSFLQKRKKVNIKELENLFNMKKDELLEWLKPLESQGIIKIHYGFFSISVELLTPTTGDKKEKKFSPLVSAIDNELEWLCHVSNVLDTFISQNRDLLQEIEKRKERIDRLHEMCLSLSKLSEIISLIRVKGKCPELVGNLELTVSEVKVKCNRFFSQDFGALEYSGRLVEAMNKVSEMMTLLLTVKDDIASGGEELAKAKLNRYFELKDLLIRLLDF